MRSQRCAVLAVVFILIGCARRPAPANRRQPLPSPSGKYVLTVPIKKGTAYPKTAVWKVTVSDVHGNVLYKDDASDFVGYLKAYWIWDNEDRVWLYNSDDGRVFYWALVDGTWAKTEWEPDAKEGEAVKLAPPPSLYPDYAKQ